MDPEYKNRIPRTNAYGWTTLASGDNDVDLLQYVIKVHNLTEAAQKAPAIAALTIKHNQAEYTQMTLTEWRIEIIISTPGDGWWSEEQRGLAEGIAGLYGST